MSVYFQRIIDAVIGICPEILWSIRWETGRRFGSIVVQHPLIVIVVDAWQMHVRDWLNPWMCAALYSHNGIACSLPFDFHNQQSLNKVRDSHRAFVVLLDPFSSNIDSRM